MDKTVGVLGLGVVGSAVYMYYNDRYQTYGYDIIFKNLRFLKKVCGRTG